MKYLWTSIRPTAGNQLLEIINPAKTKHIKGYGFGVSFSNNRFGWNHTACLDVKMANYSEPTVVYH